MQSINSVDIELQSADSLFKQSFQIHTLTDSRSQDPNSLIKIGEPNQNLRALGIQTSGFYRYIFLSLFNIFRQWHVLYFLVCGKCFSKTAVAKTFYLCSFQVDSMVSQLVLIVIYLGLQLYLRYKTYKCYRMTELKLKENTFQVLTFKPIGNFSLIQVWSKEDQSWIKINYSQLKPGHIVKIYSSIQNNNILNPVNFLPIYLPSKKSHFQLKTTKLNKFEEIKEIPIFHTFKKIIHNQNLKGETFQKLNLLKISFDYTIQNSNVFEGRLKVSENQNYKISNKQILPAGVPIVNEEFILGVVLVNCSNINVKSLKRALNAENKTIAKAGKTMIPLAFLLLLIGIISYIVEFLLMYSISKINRITNKDKRGSLDSQSETYLCLALGIGSQISYFIYVGMFILLLIHRLKDSHVLNKKNEITIKNHIKSIDEFGQTNTIIMDDFFFIDKNLFEVEDMLYTTSLQFNFDHEVIYSIIQKSEMLQEEMYDLWISTLRYLRTKPRRYTKIQNLYNAHIIKQKTFKQSIKFSTISIIVEINVSEKQKRTAYQFQGNDESLRTEKFVFRFTEKPKYTSIQRIKDQNLKLKTKLLIKNKQLLHIMVEVMKVQNSFLEEDTENYQLVSRNYEGSRYQFLALISHKINSNSFIFPLSLIKNEQITKKQNLFILSNKKWKYIELILEKNKIDTSNTVSLEEKEFQNIKYDIDFHYRHLREVNTVNEKHAILAIHCNLVSYLPRPQITAGLKRLARYCKYIIFYGCPQYEKQVCCNNLFEIYPLHIYLSNYICDLPLIEKSYLSVCEKGESTEAYVTLVVKTYKDLQYLILNEAVESINITAFTIKAFLFKNTVFIFSMIMAEFMLYEGDYFFLGSEFTGVIFLIFNAFTSFPVIYYIFFRPQVWEEPIYKNNDPNKIFKLQYINDRKVMKQFLRAVFTAVLITLISYSFLMENSIQNLFFSILTSSVVASAYYHLFIDDAIKKKVQVVLAVLTYLLFFLFAYLIQLFNSNSFQLVLIQINLTTKNTVYFYISNIVIVPFILGIFFYGMSTLSAKIQPQDFEMSQLTLQSFSSLQIPGKTQNQYGKELHFRQF